MVQSLLRLLAIFQDFLWNPYATLIIICSLAGMLRFSDIYTSNSFAFSSQLAFTCLKLIIETLEQVVKYVQS